MVRTHHWTYAVNRYTLDIAITVNARLLARCRCGQQNRNSGGRQKQQFWPAACYLAFAKVALYLRPISPIGPALNTGSQRYRACSAVLGIYGYNYDVISKLYKQKLSDFSKLSSGRVQGLQFDPPLWGLGWT